MALIWATWWSPRRDSNPEGTRVGAGRPIQLGYGALRVMSVSCSVASMPTAKKLKVTGAIPHDSRDELLAKKIGEFLLPGVSARMDWGPAQVVGDGELMFSFVLSGLVILSHASIEEFKHAVVQAGGRIFSDDTVEVSPGEPEANGIWGVYQRWLKSPGCIVHSLMRPN